jgi:O-antigen ligase/polysaccharide polymerase Wzy-like membrane protein
MVASTFFAGAALLTLVAPFEFTAPLLRLPRQSVSNLEAAVLCAFVFGAAALIWTRRLPHWRTPLTPPWLALLLAMVVASALSPVSRVNGFHMTGRLVAAFGVYLIAFNGVTTPARLRSVLTLAIGVGVVVSILAILEYRGVRVVLDGLKAFRPAVSTVGAQVRAGGPLQYPTIASMYLEVVFAFGLGVMLAELDAARHARVVALFIALAVIAEAIALTFTRAGLITMATSLLLVGVLGRLPRSGKAGARLVAALAAVIVLTFVGSRSVESLWLRMTSEGQESWYRATVVAPPDIELSTGRVSPVPITVINTGRLPWDSRATPPMLLSYHWLAADNRFVTFEGDRTAFPDPVLPDSAAHLVANVRAPRQPGRYRLEWDLVQEGRLWFSTEPGAIRTMSQANVIGSPYTGPIVTTPPPRPTIRPGRLVLWRAAARMLTAYPFTGVGPDNFRLAYGAYAGLEGADPRLHSNNMYLEVLAGGGMLAAAAFAWLLWRSASCAIAIARGSGAACGAIAPGLAAAVLAIAVHASVDSFLSFAPTYVLFSLTLGCAVACARGMETWPDANRV